MANPAAEARAKVKAAHPEAVVVERRRNSIKHRLADHPDGRQRFALDVSIGPMHYGPASDQEIDTALVPSTAPWDWEMTKAGFEVRALSNLSAGQVIEYRNGSEWVRFQPMALQYSNDLNQIQPIAMPQSVAAAVDDDTLTWTDGYGPGRSLSWQAQTARLAKLLTIGSLADLPAADQFILDGGTPVLELNLIFAHSAGVTPYVNGQPWSKGGQAQDRDTQGLVEFRNDAGDVLWWFNLPRSWDADGNQQLGTFRFKKQGNSLYVSHRVPLSFVQGAVYPLYVDVVIDEQVGAGADDAHEKANDTSFFATGILNYRDSDALNSVRRFCGDRFQTVAVPKDDTIDVANLQVKVAFTTTDDPNLDIYAEDVDDAVDFTTNADVVNRIRTTASAAWVATGIGIGFRTSPDFASVVQEVINRASWASGNDMMIITVGKSDLDLAFRTRTFENASADAAKLHIEYTAGAGGVTVLAALATATALSPAATILTGLLVAASLATATALSLAAKHINTISAKVATATAVSPASAVSGAALIAANLATATAKSFAASIITAGSITVSAALATASALAYAAKHINTIPAAVSTATAASLAATVSGAATIAGALATATARSWDATVSGAALVAGALSTATARSWAAAINPGVTIAGALATATALAPKATLVIEGVTGAVRRLAYYPISLVSTRFRRRGRR